MIYIRPATNQDVSRITEIYNDAIINTTATFDTETKSIEEQSIWLAAHNEKYPVIVAEENKLIVGWASLSRWSDRCAYDKTAEVKGLRTFPQNIDKMFHHGTQ